MKFIMRERIWSLAGRYDIRNEEGHELYHARAKLVSLGHKLTLTDSEDAEVARIEQKLLNWGPTFEVWIGNELAAVVKKKVFTFLRCKFTVDVPGPDDLLAEGNLLEHEYTFARHGKTVATVSKKWFSWSDTYGIEIDERDDEVLVLASALVIDLACHAGDH